MAGFFSQNSCANDVSVEFHFFGFQLICVIIYSQRCVRSSAKSNMCDSLVEMSSGRITRILLINAARTHNNAKLVNLKVIVLHFFGVILYYIQYLQIT